MNGKTIFALILILCIAFFSCRKDFEFDYATQNLRFSKDTVKLDTVFNQIRSETYSIKVYNTENKDVLIPRIYLEKESSSFYKLNVDGKSGYNFYDVPLKAKDSLYIFVEIAPNIKPPNTTLIDEDIIFQTSQQQKVKLLSLVEDATFFYPPTGQPSLDIATDMVWDNTQPKLIFGEVKITNGAKLTINAGTTVYFHKKSSLIIDENSQLIINGTLTKEVLFRGDRHDPYYDTLPANWEGIYLKKNTKSLINYAIIKGGNTGLKVEENNELKIYNTKIFNQTSIGLHAIHANIPEANNIVINNCGEVSIAIEKGGSYNFKHCTFANYFNLFATSAYSLYLSNEYTNTNNQKETANLNANFYNTIFWVINNNSLLLNSNSSSTFNYLIDKSLIKYASSSTYNPSTDNKITNSLFNQDPLFTQTSLASNLLTLKLDSPLKGSLFPANIGIASSVPFDIKNISRATNPSIGAYQLP